MFISLMHFPCSLDNSLFGRSERTLPSHRKDFEPHLGMVRGGWAAVTWLVLTLCVCRHGLVTASVQSSIHPQSTHGSSSNAHHSHRTASFNSGVAAPEIGQDSSLGSRRTPSLRRRKRVSPDKQAIKSLFTKVKSAISTGANDEASAALRKLERLTQYCDFDIDEMEESLVRDEEEDVAAQLAAVLGIEEDDSRSRQDGNDVEQLSSSSSRRRRSRSRTQNADKQEITRLKRIVKKLKDHQAAEVNRLMAVKTGVESLLNSLSGTKRNLQAAKKESLDMTKELERIHKQEAAAAQLEQEISEIQEHARINYETGQIELSLETGETSQLSLDEVAAKVQMAALQKERHHLKNGDHENKKDDILSNLADPAVLHADLRLLLDIVLLLGSATIGGMLAAVVYMPPLIGYIAGGVIVGPSGLDLVAAVVHVDTLAQFGSVFFLFAHGLEYSFSEQRQFQSVVVGGCLLSTVVSAICIQIYALASGIVQSPLEGGLLGLSSSLSSLSLVLDFLHEQHLLHTVHGKVMVGFLTFQGLMMGLLFSIPPAISGGVISVGGVSLALLRSASGIVLVASFGYAFSKYAMPTLLDFLTKDRENYDELYLLGVVSLAMVMALLTEFLGLSLDLGAFFAGLMLAGSPYMKRTSAAIQPLAQVFAAMLFASIGMIINPHFFWANLGVISIVVVQIIVIKVIVIVTVVRLFSYSWKVAIISGIGLAHVGEFSLLFSSKLQAHLLLSRRAYLIFLTATVTTIILAPLVLRTMHLVIPKLLKLLNVPISSDEEYDQRRRLRS